jgi:hypothetical protein
MALSKRHFQELARIAGLIGDANDREIITAELVAFSCSENPRFDARRFRDAVELATRDHVRDRRVAKAAE